MIFMRLVEWIYLNEAHITLGENISYENWQDALEALFQYMDDNRNFVLNTYRSVSKENVEDSCNEKWNGS